MKASDLCLLLVLLLVDWRWDQFVTCNLFTGVESLKELAEWEQENVELIEEYLQQEQEKLQLLRVILDDIKFTQATVKGDGLAVAGNPVEAYNLMKRWVHLGTFYDKHFRLQGQAAKTDVDVCVDKHKHCQFWANESSQCTLNPEYMVLHCPLACGLCGGNAHQNLLARQLASSGGKIPTEDDYKGAAQGIVRLQKVYNLHIDDVISGNVGGSLSDYPLTASEFIHIAEQAVAMSEYAIALQWLQQVLVHEHDVTSAEKLKSTLLQAIIYEKVKDYAKAIAIIDDYHSSTSTDTDDVLAIECWDDHRDCESWAKLGECSKNFRYMEVYCRMSCGLCRHSTAGDQTQLQLKSIHKRLLRRMQSQEQQPDDSVQAPYSGTEANDDMQETYEALCRGEQKRVDKKAVCRYRKTKLPWLTYREEVLDWDPFISFIYDVITDEEANLIRINSQLARGMVGDKFETSNLRISDVGWLHDQVTGVDKLINRVELITGLDVSTRVYRNNETYMSADEFQVVNYGIGGYYTRHTDYFDPGTGGSIGKLIQNSGERLATFLIYLSDVQAGGATVFPVEKVHVPPIKNGAAFWFNIKQSGENDPRTLHAGCPVLLGEKWVSNKWVREFGNHFTDRCRLNPDDPRVTVS